MKCCQENFISWSDIIHTNLILHCINFLLFTVLCQYVAVDCMQCASITHALLNRKCTQDSGLWCSWPKDILKDWSCWYKQLSFNGRDYCTPAQAENGQFCQNYNQPTMWLCTLYLEWGQLQKVNSWLKHNCFITCRSLSAGLFLNLITWRSKNNHNELKTE